MQLPATKPDRWIAHVDLDAFYASCEQRDHPEVVGAQPGNRGVVAHTARREPLAGTVMTLKIGFEGLDTWPGKPLCLRRPTTND
jgi:hypothetical protein